MSNITWKRGEHGSKVSKCGTYVITGCVAVGFSLWVHGLLAMDYDTQRDAKGAAASFARGERMTVWGWRHLRLGGGEPVKGLRFATADDMARAAA